ncbi:Hypothetical Protein FCC1311_056662 [Hondaea fermentalgiana]|uniref:Uncharacterized protein n=1 Tax=Hondaea fermentalgiana TaxID=2315210 RepID=A0A2R5GFU7_9STRA|nr:Hypothetical Protein FCC1311_056662 [Hondaea fermentalgiana]|eukprot:GBG29445.1 Hypothetical Protein FCC1311_056662 [Hondaea fermentalgiana]
MEEHRVHNEEENEVRGFGMDFFAVEGLQQHGEAYLEQQRHPDGKLTSEPTRGRSESLKALVKNVALILTSLRAGDTAHAVNEGPFIVPETLKVSIHHLVFKAKKSSRQDAQIYTKTRGLLGALTSEFRQDKSIEDLKDTVRVYMLQINCAQVLYKLAYLLVVDGNSLVLKQFTQFCAAVLFEQYNKACVNPLKAIIEYGGKRNAPEGFRAADSGRPGKRSRLRVTTSDSMDSVLS